MVKTEIVDSLCDEIGSWFRKEATKIYDLIGSLGQNPAKGKVLATVGGIVIKEVRYKGFRFYLLADGFKLKTLPQESLVDLLLCFVRMSDKKHQHETIDTVRDVLREIGPSGIILKLLKKQYFLHRFPRIEAGNDLG